MISEVVIIVGVFLIGLLVLQIGRSVSERQREMGRFSDQQQGWWRFFIYDLRRYSTYRSSLNTLYWIHGAVSSSDVALLRAAGLFTQQMQARYVMAREALLVGALLAVVSVLLIIGLERGVVVLPPIVMSAIWGPRFWLYIRARQRRARLRLEEVFLLTVCTAATRGGWSLVSILREVTQESKIDRVRNPLAYELNRAYWLSSVGATWQEALNAIRGSSGTTDAGSRLRSLSDLVDSPTSQVVEEIEYLSREVQKDYLVAAEQRSAAILLCLSFLVACACALFGYALAVQYFV